MKFLLQEGVDFQLYGPNARGTRFVQLFQALPWLEPLYMDWEKHYNAQPVYEFMKTIPHVPVSSTHTSSRTPFSSHLRGTGAEAAPGGKRL